jgi:hypothetical protein
MILLHVAVVTSSDSQATAITIAAIIAAAASILAALISAVTSLRAQSYDRLLKDLKSTIDDSLRSTIERLIDHIDKRG